MAVKVLVGQTVLDAVIATAGSLEDLIAFCQLNNVGITDALTPGETMQGTGNVYPPSASITNSQLTVSAIKIMPGQTIADLSIQQLGSMESFVDLASLNNMSVTQALTPGQQLNYGLTPYSQQVAQWFAQKRVHPASGESIPGPARPTLLSGIGYWGIEYDFVVQ